MEVLGTAANVLSIVDLALRSTSTLFKYAHDASNSFVDRQLLTGEVSLLHETLKELRSRITSPVSDTTWIQQRQTLLEQFKKAHDELAALLKLGGTGELPEKEGRLQALRTAAKWPFSKPTVYSILERVSRLQQYGNTLLLSDQR